MVEQLDKIFDMSIKAVSDAYIALLWPALFFLVLAFVLKRRQAIKEARQSLGSTLTNLLLIAFNASITIPIVVYLYIQIVPQTKVAGFWLELPQWLVIGIAIFAGDFIAYWRHRLEHSLLFWPSHAIHHSDKTMCWLTLQRFHPVNRIITFVVDTSFLLALQLPPFAILANNLVRHYYGYFIHADIPWTYGPLAKVFVSPVMHRWHHVNDEQYYHKNFATVFSVFDRLFGTYSVPGICDRELGIADKSMKQNFAGQLLYPFKRKLYLKPSSLKSSM